MLFINAVSGLKFKVCYCNFLLQRGDMPLLLVVKYIMVSEQINKSEQNYFEHTGTYGTVPVGRMMQA